jgi:hypothetical protein
MLPWLLKAHWGCHCWPCQVNPLLLLLRVLLGVG